MAKKNPRFLTKLNTKNYDLRPEACWLSAELSLAKKEKAPPA